MYIYKQTTKLIILISFNLQILKVIILKLLQQFLLIIKVEIELVLYLFMKNIPFERMGIESI